MKHHIRTISTVLIFTILSVFNARAQGRTFEPITFHEVFDNLYQIRGGSLPDIGLFIGDSEVLLIDTEMERESMDEVMSEIAKLTDKPIRYLITTHGDFDHANGAIFMPEGVTIIAHENARKELFGPDRYKKAHDWSKPEYAPYLPSITFSDRMTLHLGDTVIELWYFGIGHTTGDAVIYFPHAKTAFVGDQIRLWRPQLIHSYKGGNTYGHVATLTRMLATLSDAEQFIGGHDPVKSRGDIERHIENMKVRQANVRALMDDGKSLEEILTAFTKDESRLVTSIYNELENIETVNTIRSMEDR